VIYHRWTLRLKDGNEINGEDGFPSDDLKSRATEIRLLLAGANEEITVSIPVGATAILLRRNKSEAGTDGIRILEPIYLIGYELDGVRQVSEVRNGD
jgi:hypothetical protein